MSETGASPMLLFALSTSLGALKIKAHKKHNKNQKALQMSPTIFQNGIINYTFWCRKRKNVIRLRRCWRIEVPGVQKTAQTLRKQMSRAQAPRGRTSTKPNKHVLETDSFFLPGMFILSTCSRSSLPSKLPASEGQTAYHF